MKRFPEKRIVITGAASGFGRAMALRFAREGWRVLVADIQDDAGAETVQEIATAGGEGHYLRCDVTKERDVKALATFCKREWGGADIMVNNAGVATHGPIDEAPMADWQWVVDINLVGVARGCKHFAELFKEQGHGHVVNIASMAGLMCSPEMSSYSAAKAGVVALSESMRAELAAYNIDVTCVCPGFFATNLDKNTRSTDPGFDSMIQKLFASSKIDAADIADMVYTHVEKRKFWLLPHSHMRGYWYLKRFFPGAFAQVMMGLGKKMASRKLPNSRTADSH